MLGYLSPRRGFIAVALSTESPGNGQDVDGDQARCFGGGMANRLATETWQREVAGAIPFARGRESPYIFNMFNLTEGGDPMSSVFTCEVGAKFDGTAKEQPPRTA